MAAAWSKMSRLAKHRQSQNRHIQVFEQMNTKQRKRLAEGAKERQRLELWEHCESQSALRRSR